VSVDESSVYLIDAMTVLLNAVLADPLVMNFGFSISFHLVVVFVVWVN